MRIGFAIVVLGVLATIALPAKAAGPVVLCTVIAGTIFSSCVPVDTTHPLPVTLTITP